MSGGPPALLARQSARLAAARSAAERLSVVRLVHKGCSGAAKPPEFGHLLTLWGAEGQRLADVLELDRPRIVVLRGGVFELPPAQPGEQVVVDRNAEASFAVLLDPVSPRVLPVWCRACMAKSLTVPAAPLWAALGKPSPQWVVLA